MLIKDLDEKVKEDVSSLSASVDKTVQAINDRVNNLITQNNPTEGNSELQDIRLGADGVTYPSAGEAVRQQMSNLMNNSPKPIDLTFTKIYAANPGYYGGHGSYSTQDIFIKNNNFSKIHAESTTSRICWYAYKIEGEITYVTDVWLIASMNKNKEGVYVFDLDLSELIRIGADVMSIGFYGQNFDDAAQVVTLIPDDIEQDPYVANELITKKEKTVDVLYYKNSGYSGDLFELLGANKTWYRGIDSGYIDVSENKVLYFKYPMKTWISDLSPEFACFDSSKELLYKTNEETSQVECNKIGSIFGKANSGDNPAEYVGIADDGTNITGILIYKVVFPPDVKYVAYVPNLLGATFISWVLYLDSLFIVGREEIADYYQTYEDYLTQTSDRFRNLVENISGSNSTSEVKHGLFIGDSLTHWGGGNDAQNGFLKIVHDKTGIMTVNQGYAGAMWQDLENQEHSGVDRVNTLISSGIKYDIYVFILGTNGGSPTDTGETSENTSTMPGAIRYCLEKLKSYDPTKPILVCLPPQRAEGNENQEKVNEVIKSIANNYGVKTLDLYHESGIVPNTKIKDINYLSDGLHLAKNGYTILGNLLSSEIKYLLSL